MDLLLCHYDGSKSFSILFFCFPSSPMELFLRLRFVFVTLRMLIDDVVVSSSTFVYARQTSFHNLNWSRLQNKHDLYALARDDDTRSMFMHSCCWPGYRSLLNLLSCTFPLSPSTRFCVVECAVDCVEANLEGNALLLFRQLNKRTL
jgi:hypothetical protein